MKQRLLIVSSANWIGGGEIYLSTLVPGLKKDFDITVIAPKIVCDLVKQDVATAKFVPFPKKLEKIIKRNHQLKKLYYLFYFKCLLKMHKTDIVNLQWFDGAVIESIKKRPLTLTLHTAFNIPREHDSYVRKVLSGVSSIICVSEGAKQNLIHRGVDTSHVSVIRNGILSDLDFIPNKPITNNIIWVGRVEEADKNPLMFVRLAEESQRRGYDYKFSMVGDGSYLNFLKKYARDKKISNIEFLGSMDLKDIKRTIYPDAVALCLTSTSESIPYVAMESLSAGVVLFSTNVGGMAEVISNNNEGVLIDSFDVSFYLDTIRKVLTNKKTYERIRLGARKRFETTFRAEVMIKNTAKVLSNTIDNTYEPMKIGVEGSVFFGKPTGVGQYAKRLTEAASHNNKNITFDVVRHWIPFRKFVSPTPPSKNIRYRLVRWFPPAVYFQSFKRLGFRLPYDLIALKRYDAFLFYNFIAFPISKKTASIPFIHDLSFVHYPEYVSPKNLKYLRKYVPESLNRATHVVTISENSKKEIVDHYNISPEKISIVTPSINHEIYKPSAKRDIERVKKMYGIKKPYLLSVCTLEPRKNLDGVLDAFNSLPEEIKQSYTLVLGGGKGWLDGELLKKFDELSAKYGIIKTGYVADADLPALYSGATLFLFPSFYEGFGMPVLEAMACGVPVISSNNSSLPEIITGAGIMVDASNNKQLVKEIINVLEDDKLRKKLIRNGLQRAQKYSWDKSANDLIEIIRRVRLK